MYSKIQKLSYSLFLFSVIAIFSSCGGGNVEEKIAGTWQVESAVVLNLEEMVEVHKEMLGDKLDGVSDDEIKAGIIEDFTSKLKGSELLFSEGKKLTIDGQEGEWELLGDNVIIAKNGDNEFNFIIKKLDQNNFKFELIIKEKEADIKLYITCKRK